MPTIQLAFPPARVPIGSFTDGDGKQYDVLMTPEFARALSSLLVRVGGPSSFSMDDVLNAAVDRSDSNAQVAVLRARVNELTAQLEASATMSARVGALVASVNDLATQLVAANAANARMAALERRIEDIARLAHLAGPAPVDWEHPGKVGAGKANSGQFTTLEATGKVNLHPNAAIDIKPTGTGLLTILPNNTGQIDNMELGKLVPQPARVLTVNRVAITQPGAAGATLTLSDGTTFTVNATLTLSGVPGSTLNIGNGGNLGSAAFQDTGAFVAHSGTALAPVATDATTTQNLANSLRAVLLSVGIGT